jgi:hypothetical protein
LYSNKGEKLNAENAEVAQGSQSDDEEKPSFSLFLYAISVQSLRLCGKTLLASLR